MPNALPGLDQLLATLSFDRDGLVAAIAQQHDSGEVLMLAWMNRDSISETLRTGQACYWSRSRRKLWRKGEESGHTQKLIELRVDCDGDAILLLVEQKGVACHTGTHNCFFRALKGGTMERIAEVLVPPQEVYGGDQG